MTRVFERRRLWRLDEPCVRSGARLLADAATEFFGRFSLVIGIGRGGWPPAAIVGDNLHTRTIGVLAKHNHRDDICQPGDGDVHVDLTKLDGISSSGQVLLVDDICGTGATLTAIRGALVARRGIVTIRSATLCLNEGATAPPDLWVWSVRDWVVFPWESRPTAPTEPLPVPMTVNLAADFPMATDSSPRALLIDGDVASRVRYPA